MPEGARILFLGSFPPQPHRWCMPFYYPNWINDFWRIMGLIHFGDKDHFTIPGEKRFNEADIRAFCKEHGLAFYDTATEVRRLKDNASDAFLEVVTPTDIPALLKRIPNCRTLVTTGQKATEVVAEAFHCPIPPVGSWVPLRLETPDQVGGDGGVVVSDGGVAGGDGGVAGGDGGVAGGDGGVAGGDGAVAGGDGVVAGGDGNVMPGPDRASAGPAAEGNYFSGRCPKNHFPSPPTSPSHADAVEVKFWRMPSTSRAYPMPQEKKAEAYRKLFPPHKKLILWDLDGTLIDTLEDLSAAVNHALELRCLPLHSVADYRKMVGHGVRNLVKQALEASLKETPDQVGGDGSVAADNGLQLRASGSRWQEEQVLPDAYIDAALADVKEYYSAHIDVHTRPYPGMQELLTELQARGVKMAVASNKFQEGTEHLIREFFPDIQFASILGNRPGYPLKPDPEIVREVLALAAGTGAEGQGHKAAGAAGIGPEDAIMVGDSPTDMRTAANGGIDAVAVSWGYRTEEELAGNQIAHSIEELRRILCFT